MRLASFLAPLICPIEILDGKGKVVRQLLDVILLSVEDKGRFIVSAFVAGNADTPGTSGVFDKLSFNPCKHIVSVYATAASATLRFL